MKTRTEVCNSSLANSLNELDRGSGDGGCGTSQISSM